MPNSPVATGSIRRPQRRAAAHAIHRDRRIRHRLRDLCDEVLASYRVARERDLWSVDERREAQRLLAAMTPRLRH